MLLSGLNSAAQSWLDNSLHSEDYSYNDFLGDFSGGVFSSALAEGTQLGPRFTSSLPEIVASDPSFARSIVVRQEIFLGGYETARSALISNDLMEWPYRQAVKYADRAVNVLENRR